MTELSAVTTNRTGHPNVTQTSPKPVRLSEYRIALHRDSAHRRACPVRYVRLYYDAGQPWVQHSKILNSLPVEACNLDQAIYAWITDLKQRGLLEDTLVIWGGEFGR